LIGNASLIPRDGIIELLFGKEYLESRELSEAEEVLKDIEQFVEQNENSGYSVKVAIMDFALDINDEKGLFDMSPSKCFLSSEPERIAMLKFIHSPPGY